MVRSRWIGVDHTHVDCQAPPRFPRWNKDVCVTFQVPYCRLFPAMWNGTGLQTPAQKRLKGVAPKACSVCSIPYGPRRYPQGCRRQKDKRPLGTRGIAPWDKENCPLGQGEFPSAISKGRDMWVSQRPDPELRKGGHPSRASFGTYCTEPRNHKAVSCER